METNFSPISDMAQNRNKFQSYFRHGSYGNAYNIDRSNVNDCQCQDGTFQSSDDLIFNDFQCQDNIFMIFNYFQCQDGTLM